jgi:hypothetical protein
MASHAYRFMVVGKYLRASININHLITSLEDCQWGVEGKKLFIFQRKNCQSSSLAQDAEKKPSEWKF